MSLLLCKKCGKQVSSRAGYCIYCGEIIPTELKSTAKCTTQAQLNNTIGFEKTDNLLFGIRYNIK